MVFIKLTLGFGTDLYLRPDAVESAYFEPNGIPPYTLVRTRSGLSHSVKESPAQVLALVRLAQTQGHPAKQVVCAEDL